eukprot:gene15458-15267_t
MPSIQAKVMNKIASIALKSYRGNGAGFVRRFRMVTAASNLLAPVPKGLKHIKGALGGVPGEWLIPVNPKGALLYIHGGGFVAGHPPMYRPFCGALANALGSRVFMVDYRLAPENPFPAPLDDCIAAFEALVADTPTGEPIFVAGDSAGGNLSLAVLQHALKKKLPAHGGLLISPATDMRRLSPSIEGNDKTDSMLSSHMIEHAANFTSSARTTPNETRPNVFDASSFKPLPAARAPSAELQATRERILGPNAMDPEQGHLFLMDAWEIVGVHANYVPIGREELAAIQPEAIFIGHGHFDHAADAGYVAGLSNALLIAGSNVCDIARERAASEGIPNTFPCLNLGDQTNPGAGSARAIQIWEDVEPVHVVQHTHSTAEPADLLSGGMPLVYIPD